MCVPLTFWDRPCQDQRIGSRNGNQDSEMAQARFRGKVCVIREGAERIDSGMDEDAGIQAASAVKNRDKQEADRDGKNDLAQVIAKLHAAAVEQVDDMSDAEGDA